MRQVKHIYDDGKPYKIVGDSPPPLTGFKAYNVFVRNTMTYLVNKIPVNESTMAENVKRFRKSSAYDKELFKME